MKISELWYSSDREKWMEVIEIDYWKLIQPRNLTLEKSMDRLDIKRITDMNPQQWYEFLRDEYFCWKYTARNRYATTTAHLRKYVENNQLHELNRIREQLLSMDNSDIRNGLIIGTSIRGLGTAGASGLLSLIYPETYGTVDQFVVQSLKVIPGLPEIQTINRMNKDSLTVNDGVALIQIMQNKALENNKLFGTTYWTPRKIDKVLWAKREQN
jgi:hypothetical protein